MQRASRRLSLEGRPIPSKTLSVQLGSKPEDVSLSKWLHHGLFVFRSCLSFGLLVVVGISCFITYFIRTLSASSNDEDSLAGLWISYLDASKTVVSIVGAFLAFALVIRTNICYSRWWEGRELWGALILSSVHTVQQGRSWISNEEKADRLSCAVITFAYTAKALLRGNSIHNEDEEGLKLVERGILCKEELHMMSLQGGWQPHYCLDVVRAVINQVLAKKGDTNLVGEAMRNAAQLSIEKTLRKMVVSLGGLIRVKSTGLPIAYNSLIYVFIAIFFLMASLAWAPSMGWYSPVLIGGTYMIINMLLTIGDCMEDPFGDDISDLPLQKFCKAIETQICAISDRKRLIQYDLGVGPNQKEAASFRGSANSALTYIYESDENDTSVQTA